MVHVIDNIKRIRDKKGYSHEYVAHELNISQVAYSKIEKMQTRLTVKRLYKLADIFETDIAELLGIETTNQHNQTSKESATGYLQKIEHFYQENKEQNQKIIGLYEARLQDKDRLISRLEKLIG